MRSTTAGRDYGTRAGIWRTVESLDRHGIRASVLLNSAAAIHYPQIIQAGLDRDWAWLAHGQTNSILHASMTREEERRVLTDITGTIAGATKGGGELPPPGALAR
jgi:allantoinase